MLEEERDYYDQSLHQWLKDFPGRVVLVKGTALCGVFDTEDAALAEGARLYGLQSFLVRRVAETQGEVLIPALTLGILSADPPSATGG